MSEPHLTSEQGVYRSIWEAPEYVTLTLDRVHSERSGDVWAELRVDSTAPGIAGVLHRTRHNLTSTSALTTLARHLATRTPGHEIEWASLLEQARWHALDAHRQGEPGMLLRDAERPPDAGWLLPPIILGSHPTIIFGDGGSGKSYIALAAGLAIHMDRADLLGLEPTATRVVGFLDWEFSPWDHRERMRALVGDSMPDLAYLRCYGPITEQLDRIRHWILEYGVQYLIVDSVAAACGGPPEDAQSALAFFDALRSLGLGALCIAHQTKAGDEQRPFGSAFWANNARASWYLSRQADAPDGFTIGMFNRKSNTGPLHGPLAFRFRFEGDRTIISPEDARDVPEIAAHLPIRSRLIHALSAGARLRVDLAEELDESPETVNRTIRRYLGRDFTTIERDGIEHVALLETRREASA